MNSSERSFYDTSSNFSEIWTFQKIKVTLTRLHYLQNLFNHVLDGPADPANSTLPLLPSRGLSYYSSRVGNIPQSHLFDLLTCVSWPEVGTGERGVGGRSQAELDWPLVNLVHLKTGCPTCDGRPQIGAVTSGPILGWNFWGTDERERFEFHHPPAQALKRPKKTRTSSVGGGVGGDEEFRQLSSRWCV